MQETIFAERNAVESARQIKGSWITLKFVARHRGLDDRIHFRGQVGLRFEAKDFPR